MKNQTHAFKILLGVFFTFSLSACDFSCSGSPTAAPKSSKAPSIDENYAYQMILEYEKFGPKVPGTDANTKAGDWIVAELKKYTPTVHEQKGTATTFDKKTIPFRNIIAQFNPSASTRYLFSAHWDNRPFADEDQKNKVGAVPGVNDGGSGVVVLLAIAKALQNEKLNVGIDLAFWDAEDWGTPSNEESYCLGSQYWAKNPVPANYQAKYGINFDMVGRIGSVFPIDQYSFQKGPEVISKLQAAAKTLGYQDFFPAYRIGPIIDDHYYVTEIRKFPVIDLIYMTPEGRFPPEWHTHQDTSQFISRDVLKVVAQTALQTIWQ